VVPHKSDWPTIPPAFDVAKFAKESDRRIGVVKAVPPDPEGPAVPEESGIRLLTRPEMRAALSDEAWARSMTGVPVVVMSVELLKRLPLDHRGGFLLSLMDGAIDLDTMVEIAGMNREEGLRLVRDLYESGVVDFRTSG
jgi:hypothetical protein